MSSTQEIARRRAHMPEGVSSFLNTRTLATDQRRLAELLRPGMAVLDSPFHPFTRSAGRSVIVV
jgi:hypothetical protein